MLNILLISNQKVSELVFDSFTQTFFDAICSNQHHSYSVITDETIRYEKTVEIIQEKNINLIISINRSGLSNKILDFLSNQKIKIITIFNEYTSFLYKKNLRFIENDYVYLFGTNTSVDLFEHRFPICNGKVFLLPHILNDEFPFYKSADKLNDILFLDTSSEPRINFEFYIDKVKHDRFQLNKLLQIINNHKNKYNYNIVEEIKANINLLYDADDNELLESIDSMLSVSNTVEHLNAVCNLDLKIYATSDEIWKKQILPANLKLFNCYKFLKTPAQPKISASLYHKHKILINIMPFNMQNMLLQPNVFEAFACKCLVITCANSKIILSKLGFHDGIDFIAYNSPEDLRAQVKHYLTNEQDRLKIVNSAYEKSQNILSPSKIVSKIFLDLGLPNVSSEYSDTSSIKDAVYNQNINKYGYCDEDVDYPLTQLELDKYHTTYNNMLRHCKSVDNDLQKIKIIKYIGDFLVRRNIGILASYDLESELLKIAEKYHFSTTKACTPNSFLHVMTVSYITGGHTRVVERWLDNSPSEESHCVILLDQSQSEMPQRLLSITQRYNRKLIDISPIEDSIEKFLKLREIATEYSCVILHIHPQDPTAVLAFGHSKFKTPVAFFNHAEHLFNFGVAVSDLFIDFRNYAKTISQERRGVKNSFVLPLPVEKPSFEHKFDYRTKFELPQDAKIILSIGNSFKFKPINGLSFQETICGVLDENVNSYFFVIGVYPNDIHWQLNNDRIFCLGEIPSINLEQYINGADLFIEPFPFASFLATLDCAKANIPTLVLKTPVQHIDCIIESHSVCGTIDELKDKAYQVLTKNNSNKFELAKTIEENHYPLVFKEKLFELKKVLMTLKHKIHAFEATNADMTDYEIFSNNTLKRLYKEEDLLSLEQSANRVSTLPEKNLIMLFTKIIRHNRIKLFVYCGLLSLSQLPIINLFLKQDLRDRIFSKIQQIMTK